MTDRPAQSAPMCPPWCGGEHPLYRISPPVWCTVDCKIAGRPLNPAHPVQSAPRCRAWCGCVDEPEIDWREQYDGRWYCSTTCTARAMKTAQAAPDGGRLSERMRRWAEAYPWQGSGEIAVLYEMADEVAALEAQLAAAERDLTELADIAVATGKARLAAERDVATWKNEALHRSEMQEAAERERDEAVARERTRCHAAVSRHAGRASARGWIDALDEIRDGKTEPK